MDRGSPVGFAAVAGFDNDHEEYLVLDAVEDALVAGRTRIRGGGELAHAAQLRRFPPLSSTRHRSAKGAGILLMQTSVGPSTATGHALLLAELRNTMRAVHDMHKASGRLQDAERVRAAAMDELTEVRVGEDVRERGCRHHRCRMRAGNAAWK